MKFSLVIPTKNRQLTAIKAIESGTLSNHLDIEIIVTDVSDNDNLRAKIKKLKDTRIKYFHHDKNLSMRDNWEFGVSKATGDYISVIGDDDALTPDGYLLAAELIKLSGTSVIYCRSPNYKWPDYPLISRRNLIELKLPTTIQKVTNLKKQLRRAYEFKEKFGTGPGIYHGIVSKKFLNGLKSKRGSYFVDEVPDFDSGFCTLLYAEEFLETTYPIFVSGQCGASNSGSINIRSKNSMTLSKFAEDASMSMSQLISEDFDKLVTNSAVLAGAMLRFLPEVNKEISGEKIEINKQNLFDYLAASISAGYENTTFKIEKEILEKVAKKWKVSAKALPEQCSAVLGLIEDKGHNKKAILKEEPINSMRIDGNILGVRDIKDATKFIESTTVEWFFLLRTLGLHKNITHPIEKYTGVSTSSIIEMLNKNDEKGAIAKLEKNLMVNPLDVDSLLLLGSIYFNQKNFHKAIPHLARSLSLEFKIKTFDAYFHSLVDTNQAEFARQVVKNYSEELDKVNSQLQHHCLGIIEMKSGNYECAAKIFKKIKPEIDPSLFYYCSAYAKFIKGEALNADKLVREALSFNSSREEYLSLQAKIEAHS